MNRVIKKVFVIGSTGFIGRRLVDCLVQENAFDVSGIASKDIDFLNRQAVCEQIPKLAQDAIVVMTAAITPDRGGDCLTSFQKNITMDVNIAEAVQSTKIRKMIYLSSVDIYGRENLILPLNEDSKLQPSNFYGLAKLAGEGVFQQICKKNNIPLSIIRPGPIYGPQDTHQSPIQKMVQAAVKEEAIKLIGNGEEVRDFIYIDDAIKMLKILIERNCPGVFHAVTSRSRKIKEIVQILENFCGHPLRTEPPVPNPDSDMLFEKPKLLEEGLEFDFTSLEEGLKKTFEYTRQCLGQHT